MDDAPDIEPTDEDVERINAEKRFEFVAPKLHADFVVDGDRVGGTDANKIMRHLARQQGA